MSDMNISCRIGSARRQRGWTQLQLASRSGVSRAEISAIETGRLTPSTATALRLAAALDQTVEELFSLASANGEPQWAWPPGAERGRFWEARVGNRRLLIPVEATPLGSLPHDGCFDPEGIHRRPRAVPEETLVVAGCDPGVGLLAGELSRRDGIRLLPLVRGSRAALELLEKGLVHAAGVHWSDGSSDDANGALASSVLDDPCRLLTLARWQEGVALEPSVRARSADSLARARLRWIARERGSGARLVLDRLLGQDSGRPPRFRHEAHDHRSVAQAIRSGYAQAGVTVRQVAEEEGLGFFSLQEEDYELCYREELRSSPPLAALRKAVRRAGFRRLLRDLPGLDVGCTGEERRIA